MIRYFLVLNIFFVWVNSIFGQHGTICNCDSLYLDNIEPRLIGDAYFYGKIGKGSLYFTDDWLSGDVVLSSNVVVKNKKLRYNGFIDRLIWLVPDVYQQVKLDKESVGAFTLYDKQLEVKHEFRKICIKELLIADSTKVYAKLLYKNKVSLYAYYKVELAGTEMESGNSHFVDVYAKKTVYYFMFDNGQTLGFKRFKKRDIINLFPGKKEQILKNFRKYGQRRFKTEADLIKITEVLNGVL